MRTSWLFRCYLDAIGVDLIDAWLKDQTAGVQAKIDTRMKFLKQTPRDKWIRPGFDTYKDGLSYIRFEVGNLQYRVFGCSTGEAEYTWLLGSTKKGKKFSPSNAEKAAAERKSTVLSDRSRSCDCFESIDV